MKKNKKMMGTKSFLIIGMGEFGRGVAKTLAHQGAEIIVIDKDPEQLEELESLAEACMCADASNPDVLSQLGVTNFDGIILATCSNLEKNVLITMQLKELGCRFLMVKAANNLQGRIITKLGADKIIYPEREMGIHVANQIARDNYFEAIELSEKYLIVDLAVPEEWKGKSIEELAIRQNFRLNLIAIKRKDDIQVNPQANERLEDQDILLVLGETQDVNQVRERFFSC